MEGVEEGGSGGREGREKGTEGGREGDGESGELREEVSLQLPIASLSQ